MVVRVNGEEAEVVVDTAASTTSKTSIGLILRAGANNPVARAAPESYMTRTTPPNPDSISRSAAVSAGAHLIRHHRRSSGMRIRLFVRHEAPMEVDEEASALLDAVDRKRNELALFF
jgi:hypothetical protein